MLFGIISQSVGRRSLLELHCKTFSTYLPGVNHYIFFPYGKGSVQDILDRYGVIGLDTSDVMWRRNDRIPDSGYGMMLGEIKESKFLFVHDDVYLTNAFDKDRLEYNLAEFDFYGLLDSVTVRTDSVYSSIKYDGIPLSELRLGTYFLGGDKNLFLTNGMSTGNIERLIPIYSQWKYGLYKLRFNGIPRMDGGFDFNLKILNQEYSVKRERNLPGVVHLERFTNFFSTRGLNASNVDASLWMGNSFDYGEHKRKNDYSTLMRYANIFASHEIKDDFLNIETITEIYG